MKGFNGVPILDTLGQLEAYWQHFKNATMPSDASKIQISDMRKAFFAGYVSAREHINIICADKLLTEAEIEKYVKLMNDDIQHEILIYRLTLTIMEMSNASSTSDSKPN